MSDPTGQADPFRMAWGGPRAAGMPALASGWLLAALVGLFPTFVFLNASITKDVGMVAAWLPAVGLLYWYRSQGRPLPVVAGIAVTLLLAYGTLVRSNAVFALGPLLLYALAPVRWV